MASCCNWVLAVEVEKYYLLTAFEVKPQSLDPTAYLGENWCPLGFLD
jgi:hypothetical protein